MLSSQENCKNTKIFSQFPKSLADTFQTLNQSKALTFTQKIKKSSQFNSKLLLIIILIYIYILLTNCLFVIARAKI